MSKKDCPICGKPNQCAIEQGKAPETCWCNIKKPPVELIKSTFQSDRVQCLCENCWDKHMAVKK